MGIVPKSSKRLVKRVSNLCYISEPRHIGHDAWVVTNPVPFRVQSGEAPKAILRGLVVAQLPPAYGPKSASGGA
jgi:hypothetical protein